MTEYICGSCGDSGAAYACSRCKAARKAWKTSTRSIRKAWKTHKLHCRPAFAEVAERLAPTLPTSDTAKGSPTDFARALDAFVPEGLVSIDAGPRGRGLAAKKRFDPGQEISREYCLAWASSFSSPDDSSHKSSEAPADAARELQGIAPGQDSASLTLAALLLRAGKAQYLQGLCAGPRHWLKLADMRRILEDRCGSVQRLLAAGRRQGRWTLDPSNAEVMDMDLRRIGSNVTPGKTMSGSRVALGFSLLNHSCSPNAVLQWRGPEYVLVCLRHIEPEEEVCVSYVNELDGVLSRRYFLLEQQGFRCLCPRCQANFSGVGEDVLAGWRCLSCNGRLREEAVKCSSCSKVVTKSVRGQRQMREQRALQVVNRAAQTARAGGGPASAISLLQQAVQELQAVKPAGSSWLVKVLGLLHSCLTDSGARSEAEVVASKLVEQRAIQRDALAAEAHAAPLDLGGDDVWARRLVAALRVYEPTDTALQRGRKRRAGPPADGGYVIWDEGSPLCSILLSYGVDTNVDFEAELAAAGARVLLFDHTVPGPPRHHPNFVFKQEALADESIEGVAGTLESHIAGHEGTAMLKVDVEGAEFAALLATPQEVLARFEQVCIELHWLGRPTRGGDFRKKAMALEWLNENFVLIHAHGNSYGDLVEIAGCMVPDVLEALYVNRRLLSPGDVKPSCRGIPDPSLDVNNCAFLPDIALTGPPFGADIA